MFLALFCVYWHEILLIRNAVLSLQIPNFLVSQVRRLNENSNRRYQFYDRRFKNLLKKIQPETREKPEKNKSEVSWFSIPTLPVLPL